VIGGTHVGFNYQLNPWLVVGAEGSVDGTSLSHTVAVPVNDFFFDTPGVITATTQADVQGSIRGRIGIAFDRALIYGIGGVAFTGYKTTLFDETGFFTGLPGTGDHLEHARPMDRGRRH
jgi:outer membrane immunogenic protein